MGMDELEPVDDAESLFLDANELCREDACFARVPELEGIEDEQEAGQWMTFLLGLDDADSGDIEAWESVCAVPGLGWIEDEHGGARYVEDD